METVLVRKSLRPAKALSRAATTIKHDFIIGVKERELIKEGRNISQGVLRIHLFGKGDTIKKFLFIVNSCSDTVLSVS
ncbi:MAG TPA: hypothetical protein PLD14_00235 [Candidatus Pacearchaeota archaeon]|nr:hypothetical protein [Candidatus Pacearchaeota archaeon]HPR79642.1 hypothetical protein [Candidatus Pacearchaeota archaeon]